MVRLFVCLCVCRSSNDLQIFRSECVPCSDSELEKAIEWLWQLDCSTPTSGIAIVDSIQTAMADDIVNFTFALILFLPSSIKELCICMCYFSGESVSPD